jgi:excisionase family DNA binding protein
MSKSRPLTIREAAEALNLSQPTIRAWIARRRIGFIRIGGRSIRVPTSEIDRLLSEGMVPAREHHRRRSNELEAAAV